MDSQPDHKEQYAVYSPEGARVFEELGRPAPVSLETAVVGELWDMAFRGDLIFRLLREFFRTRYPAVDFISYREFGDIHGPYEREVVRKLPNRLSEFGCTVAIAGVGA